MSKRYVLVHDCGYVLKVGDMVTFSNNNVNQRDRPMLIGLSVPFLAISDAGSGGIKVDTPRQGKQWYLAKRFDCTVQEIDDEETNPCP